MNFDSYLLIESHLRMQAEQRLMQAISRVRQARSLQELVRSMSPAVPPQVRAVARSLPSYRRLRFTADQAAESLVNAQLEGIRKAVEPEQSMLIERYQRQEWIHLRGNFPKLAIDLQRQLQMLIQARQQASYEEDASRQSNQPAPKG